MSSLARIVDANANRAREALRVMEDAARFALDDAALCHAIKQLRHDLRDALEAAGLDRARLLASRDAAADVGASLETAAEHRRAGLPGIVAAAACRLGEALRSIEEAAKAGGAGVGGVGAVGVVGGDARPFERLRFRAYQAEQRLVLALGAGGAPQWRLCIIITESRCIHHPWETVAELALQGGADCIQLREKSLDDAELLARARRTAEICRGTGGAACIVNDRPDIALLAGARGVHLGGRDLPIREVRRLVGFSMLIGASAASLDQARAAAGDGADYLGIGAMFPTHTRQNPRVGGVELWRRVSADPAAAQRPRLAIGGISHENIGLLAEAGCPGVAVCTAVCGARRPDEACAGLLRRLADQPS